MTSTTMESWKTMLGEFVAGLKSRSDDVREKTAHQLQQYVDTELREMNIDEYASFMNDLNHHIFEMVSGSEVHEKKGGVMAISKNEKWAWSLIN